MGYRQWLQQWAFYNTRKFRFTMKRLHSGWLCSKKILNSWQRLPWHRVPATCHKFYLYTFTWQSHWCMHACPLGSETLRDWVWSNMWATGLFFLGVNHRCCANRIDRTWSRAWLFDVSKKGKPVNRNWTLFPLLLFKTILWRISYPMLGCSLKFGSS